MFQDRFPWTNIHELNLDWILKHFREFITMLGELEDWKTQHEAEYEELKMLYDNIIAGNFPESMKISLQNWISANLVSIIGAAIKMVFFVLEDGHLVAYIPDSWSELVFGTTGLDDFTPGYSFGHLTLTY